MSSRKPKQKLFLYATENWKAGLARSPSICPVCNRPFDLPPEIIFNDKERPHTVTTPYGSVTLKGIVQSQVFGCLLNRYGHAAGLTAEDLVNSIFAADPNGGPTDNAIRQCVARLRKRLVFIGLVITRGPRDEGGYKLLLLDVEHAQAYTQEIYEKDPDLF